MTSRERRKLERLEKRAAWLRQRIGDRPLTEATFDRAELGALEWALSVLYEVIDSESVAP